MFKTLHIQNYQSLKDVKVELGAFTIVVGPSDSGKSAFFRSLSTLVSNKRGSDFITHGEKLCTITAELDQGTLVLQRGSSTADNFYKLTQSEETKTFSKLSGTVPEEVSTFLKIPAKDPINLASQFDKPYLLDTKEYGPSEVARILGALTNVNLLFEGARESDKQKRAATATLKTRTSDLDLTEEKMTQYENLESEVESVSKAEKALEQAEAYNLAKVSLTDLLGSMEDDQSIIAQVSSASELEVPDIEQIEKLYASLTVLNSLIDSLEADVQLIIEASQITQLEVPDLTKIELLQSQVIALGDLINELELDGDKAQTSNHLLNGLIIDLSDIETEYNETLRKAGTCPTCGNSTNLM